MSAAHMEVATVIDFEKLPKRMQSRIVFEPTSGCWLWTGKTAGRGYGQTWNAGRHQYAHRVAYELLVGPIPDGLTIDHLCHTPACMNPDHLEPVTMRENQLRGGGIGAVNSRKTHCPRGHAYDADNLYVGPTSRGCRACNRAKSRARRAAERAA